MLGVDEACYNEGKLLGHVGFHDYDGYIEKPELEVKVRDLSISVGTHVYCLKTGYGYHFVSFQILTPEQYRKWKLKCREIFPSDYKDDLCETCLIEMDVAKGKPSNVIERLSIAINRILNRINDLQRFPFRITFKTPTYQKEFYLCPRCGRTKLLVKRVLRGSPKPGPRGNAMRPEFLLSWFFYGKNPVRLSQGHLNIYNDVSLFESAMIPYLYESIVETTEMLGVEVEMVQTELALCKYLTKAHLEVEEE